MKGKIRKLGVVKPDTCPFLVPVTADRLWTYPVGAYCRRPDHRVRVPAASTLARVCTTRGYRDCAGYRSGARLQPQEVTA